MLFPRRRAHPESFLADMDEKALEQMNRNLKIVLRLMDLADLASLAFSKEDYETSFKALADYHALRQEHAERIIV